MSKNETSAPYICRLSPIRRAGRRRVFVRDLEIVASVGVLEREKRYEQRIFVSADLLVRDDYDGVSDRLADVLDYSKVVDGIARLVQGEHVNLIETLAERIAGAVPGRPAGRKRAGADRKARCHGTCRSVGIEIERRRVAAS